MSSSPPPTTAKAAEDKKGKKEDHFSPFLGSVGWKDEWAVNRSVALSEGGSRENIES